MRRLWVPVAAVIIGALLFASGLVAAHLVFAQESTQPMTGPGTQMDPLVTRSYVDHYVALQVVTVPPGQKLVAEEGTEIIVRAGKGTAIASANGGLADLTAGRDLKNGEVVALNHLLVVPRTDGRGLAAVTMVVALVRGGYTVGP